MQRGRSEAPVNELGSACAIFVEANPDVPNGNLANKSPYNHLKSTALYIVFQGQALCITLGLFLCML